MPEDDELVDLLTKIIPDERVRKCILVDNPTRLFGFALTRWTPSSALQSTSSEGDQRDHPHGHQSRQQVTVSQKAVLAHSGNAMSRYLSLTMIALLPVQPT